ncbi:hypothetical protein H0A43_00295 [Arcobacter lanthieri]|uniref:hypothetical protein n=1 Tax=Aliarcobacter lanthieri TaxID=1355374 RepID=UPI001920A51E|nr:hypothetical protein [Aliarcobacter lanthieri]MBL3518912.1 hypothetical protein [Aliarcobacter lanthieri]
MNMDEEIKQYMEQIDNLGFAKILNLNSKQTAGIFFWGGLLQVLKLGESKV